MHVDMARAYFYVEASREIYVKLPVEDMQPGDEDRCGRLRKATYGTRDAAQNWQRKCSGTVRELGFVTGQASPCHSHQADWGVCGIVHGDDFVFVGGNECLQQIAEHMRRKYKIKVAVTSEKEPNELRVLNRSIKWAKEGIRYESDHRHADKLVEELELRPG